MRNVIKVLLLVTIVLVSACESEQKQSNKATGMLSLQLAASKDVINTTTRTEGGSSGNEGDNTENDDSVPNVGDFTIALMDGNVVKTSWDKFSEYPKYAVLPVGTYVLKAYYGSSDKEGFESPYYEGTQEITIEDDATVEANITCYLTNVKVTVEYTDAFKKYFSDYTTTVQSASGIPVVFSKNEVRAAYVKPGTITVYANVKKQNGQSAKLNVLDIDEAKAREFYRLKLDIDAGSATLKISFDDTTVEKPIEINVSDDILNMQPPFFTASGYSSGEMQEIKEGSSISPLSMLITARNGIKKCVLITQSTSLLAQGWPASIDLVNPKGEDLEKMKTLGLSMRGLSTNVDKMATLDFSEVISNLQYIGGDDENTFSIVVIDRIGRVNEQEEVIKVKVLDNQFAVGTVDALPVNATSFILPITLDGDLTTIKYQYQENGVWLDIVPSSIASEGINHQVTITLPFMIGKDLSMKISCGSRTEELMISVKPLIFSLQASEMDCWATKAIIHLVYNDIAELDYLQNNMTLQYMENGTDNWVTTKCTVDDEGLAEMTGLLEDQEKARTYQVRAVCVNGVVSTNVVTITTEIAKQLPNAGFESWSWNQTDKNGKPITKNLDLVYWKKWFPWAENEAGEGWNTLNEKTTQDGAAPSKFFGLPTPPYVGCCYVANSGTIPTTDCTSGTYAALVRTVGWGSGSAAAGGASKKGDAGYLYLGTLNKSSYTPQYGIEFSSRPSGVSFMCKYKPKNPVDKFIAKIVVLDSEGNIISEKQLSESECGENSNYTLKRIELDYPKGSKKASKMYILFQSGTQVEPGSTNYDYPPGANLSDGEFLGAQLYIDDVKLVY